MEKMLNYMNNNVNCPNPYDNVCIKRSVYCQYE